MKKIIVALILLSVFSCTKTETVEPSNGSTTTFSTKKGGSFNIELPVASSIGSTGVSWQLTTPPDNKIIKVDSIETIENPKSASYWGTQVWHMTAIATGTATFQFKFIRPSSPTEVYNQKTYSVSIVE